MRFIVLILMLVPLVVLSQITPTEIPRPTEISDKDSVLTIESIGRFDEDVFSDLLIIWGRVEGGIGTTFSYASVYSFKKNQNLVVIEINRKDLSDKICVEDLDDDITNELIIVNQIYKYTGTGFKKKAQ